MFGPSASTAERGALLGSRSARLEVPGGEAGGDVLRWWSAEDGRSDSKARSYGCVFPWEVCLLLAMGGAGLFVMLRLWLHPVALESGAAATVDFEEACLVFLFILFAAAAASPRKVVVASDTFSVEFPFYRCEVAAGNVLELMMIGEITHFIDLLWRWGIVPFGIKPILFWGMPSWQGSACALLATWPSRSCYFVLHDPIQFLVDIQKPLDVGSRYRTAGYALIREGESLRSKRVASVPEGQTLRVKAQSGRRVCVEFESCDVKGWMSHINQLGYFLLTKELDVGDTAAGTVGATELKVSYGAAIELPNVKRSSAPE